MYDLGWPTYSELVKCGFDCRIFAGDYFLRFMWDEQSSKCGVTVTNKITKNVFCEYFDKDSYETTKLEIMNQL